MEKEGKKPLKETLEELALKREKKELGNEKVHKTARQLLLSRLKTITAQVPIVSGAEDFTIEVRLLSPLEIEQILGLEQRLIKYQGEVPKVDIKDVEAQKALAEKGKNLLTELYRWAGRICVDPELNEDFWVKGEGFNLDVPPKIVKGAVDLSQKSHTAVRSFRLKRKRARAVPISDSDKKDS